MNKNQIDAVRQLWDSLSEYLEEPTDDVVPGSVKDMGLQAIAAAQKAFPELAQLRQVDMYEN